MTRQPSRRRRSRLRQRLARLDPPTAGDLRRLDTAVKYRSCIAASSTCWPGCRCCCAWRRQRRGRTVTVTQVRLGTHVLSGAFTIHGDHSATNVAARGSIPRMMRRSLTTPTPSRRPPRSRIWPVQSATMKATCRCIGVILLLGLIIAGTALCSRTRCRSISTSESGGRKTRPSAGLPAACTDMRRICLWPPARAGAGERRE